MLQWPLDENMEAVEKLVEISVLFSSQLDDGVGSGRDKNVLVAGTHFEPMSRWPWGHLSEERFSPHPFQRLLPLMLRIACLQVSF